MWCFKYKKIYLSLFSLLLQQLLFSQDAVTLSFVPPGTIMLNDSLYIDQAPVDNLMFLEFIDHVKRVRKYVHTAPSQREKLHITTTYAMATSLPAEDIDSIYNRIVFAEIYRGRFSSENYLRHPVFSHMPALNIPKDLAAFYCRWRTDMVELLWAEKMKHEPQVAIPKIQYRLPTTQEFELAYRIFDAESRLKISTKNSPLKMEISHDKIYFQFYRLPEFTLGNENFLATGLDANRKGFTGFRCVCEYKQPQK
ncbi:MAG: SUMF1/EgtB/PvdO family nonheme iron enzyme [Salinimicrobium sp.]